MDTSRAARALLYDDKYAYLTRYHGWVLATAFALLMPLAIVVSRCFKERRGIWWVSRPIICQLALACFAGRFQARKAHTPAVLLKRANQDLEQPRVFNITVMHGGHSTLRMPWPV